MIEIVAFDLAGNESEPRAVELSGFSVPEDDVNPTVIDEDEDLVRVSSGYSQGSASHLWAALALLLLVRRRA